MKYASDWQLIRISFCSRWPKPPQPVQFQTAAEEETKIAHRLHQPPDFRAGETIPVPKVPQSGRQGRNCAKSGPDQCPSDHVVPEPQGQAQKGHGGAEKGRGKCENSNGSQEFFRDRSRLGCAQEKGRYQ